MKPRDEATRTGRVTLTVVFDVFGEFMTDAELDELLQRCMFVPPYPDRATAVGLEEAIVRAIEEPNTQPRIGYSADGNKDAYLNEGVSVESVMKIELLPRA